MKDSKYKNLIRIIVAIVVSLVIIAIPLTVKLVVDNRTPVEDGVPEGGDTPNGETITPPSGEDTESQHGEDTETTHPETVTIKIEIGCHRLFEPEGEKYIAEIERCLGEELFAALNGGDMVYLETMTMPYGSTVMDATKDVLAAHGIAMSRRGGYISSMGGLAEKMAGGMSGWVYVINGRSIMAGADKVRLYDGDVITWIYLVG